MKSHFCTISLLSCVVLALNSLHVFWKDKSSLQEHIHSFYDQSLSRFLTKLLSEGADANIWLGVINPEDMNPLANAKAIWPPPINPIFCFRASGGGDSMVTSDACFNYATQHQSWWKKWRSKRLTNPVEDVEASRGFGGSHHCSGVSCQKIT